jgi:hypothetical protein
MSIKITKSLKKLPVGQAAVLCASQFGAERQKIKAKAA